MANESDKRLYLVDGHALAYRSYFAMIRAPMTNSKGQPTGALFGFTNSLLKLIQDYRCPYLGVVFDGAKPTFRHELYPEYKAHREAMPDDMRAQMALIRRVVEAFNIPQLCIDGVEADDVIARLAGRAALDGFRVWLVTKDKDLMQTVDERVHLLAPDGKGGMADMGPAEVEEKMGVPPALIRDLLALVGDTSDNVPGVPGVGPKTALKILGQAGSLERVLEEPSLAGSPRLAQKLVEHRESIELSRKLVTLSGMDGLEIDIESLKAREVDRKACRELFAEMEFSSLMRNPLFQGGEKLHHEVHVVATLEQVRDLAARIRESGRVCIDTETTSTVPREASLVGISMALTPDAAYYVPVGHSAEPERNLPLQQVLEALREMIESDEVAKIGQNLKYDYQVLRNYGLTMQGLRFDTMVAAYLLDPGRRQYGLDELAVQWLQVSPTPIEALIGKRGKDQKSFAEVEVDRAAAYSCEDVVLPLRLEALFEPLLVERALERLFTEIEMPLVMVLAEMEWHGIAIDGAFLRGLSRTYGAELESISADIYRLAGTEFNLNSPKQVSEVLYHRLGLPKGKRIKTGLSTDVNALEKLSPKYPVARRLLDYRELQKLLSTYIDALPREVSPHTGRVHTSFNQTVTATGRLSSANPNLQNIPIRSETGILIREAFIAPPGHVIVAADYSQIELRILAHLSDDAFLKEAFMEDADIHTQTAAAIYGIQPELVAPEMRRAAKTINFGLMYGMGAANLARQLGISFGEAQVFIDAYFRQFPSIKAYTERAIRDARTRGYSETLLGRRRYVADIDSERRQLREAAERIAINTPVQGSAADIMKIAMVAIQHEIGERFDGARMLLQVHDELVFEVPEQFAEPLRDWAVDTMANAYELCVPLRVDAGIGKNWREAH